MIRFSFAFLPVFFFISSTGAETTTPAAQRSRSAIGAPLLTDTNLPCPGPDCGVTPRPPGEHALGLRRVYLNFEGVTLTSSSNNEDATNDTSFVISQLVSPGATLTIPPFDTGDLESTQGLTRQQIIQYTLNQMYETHQDYNIEFTTTRPASGTYHMVVFGGSCSSVVGQYGCGGIAHLDCGDFVPSNVVFVFPQTGNGLRVGDLAATASQELAHAFGLSHTEDTSDIMYPSIRTYIPTQYGAGPIPPEDQSGACNAATYQDSDEKMMSTIGYRGQDTVPPTVSITEPANGARVKVGDPVTATIADDADITEARLLINNAEVASKSSPPWEFQIPAGSAQGQVFLEVEATDSSDNDAGHRVSIYLGTGDELPCEGGQCDEGYDCIEGLCYSTGGESSGALGDVCTGNGQCDSNLCATSGDEQRCSRACDEETACPEGFHCIGNVACWPDAPPEDGEEGSFCSTTSSGSGASGAFGLLALAALLSRRRRH